ncbi:MAG: phage shock protein PspA [Rhodospirillales bacterium]|jgi:phage shock protein A|nr:phage shock protein PspA [Rhodospirillales bacterium]MDP6884446.1 phage shock protein PspA [Rhodospirillales bacterium]
MGIFSRLADIINSNLTAILDRAEDPEKIIRLMIQEMEETLVEVRSTAARLIADRKETKRTLDRLAEAQAEWQRKAELAVSRGREDLAKGALVERAKLERTAEVLAADVGGLDAALTRHEDDIAKLEAKLREARAKQKTIQARQETATSQLKVRWRIDDKRIEDAFARFEHMERRIDAVEGEVESFDLGKGKSLSEEIAELEAESAIMNELESLKTRVGGKDAATGRK